MKICLTSMGETIDSQLDPRFGRCNYFIIYDTESTIYKVLKNVASNISHGAGIESVQTILKENVDVVITGNLGPNALRALNTSNIKIMTNINGTIKEIIEKIRNKEISF